MSKKKILIFDDEVSILEIMIIIFEDKGYEVKISENTDDIISKVDNFLPDIILMDVYIPPIGGLEACETLEAHSIYNQIPVIYISASNNLTQFFLGSHAVDFLCKPFDLEELERKVEKWI